MFQPQATPYAAFAYGMGTGPPLYTYNQQPHLITNTYLVGDPGGEGDNGLPFGASGPELGGAERGSYGPGGGLPVQQAPVAFQPAGAAVGGVTASGPAGGASLFLTSPPFNTNTNPEPSGPLHSSLGANNLNSHHRHQQHHRHRAQHRHNQRQSHHRTRARAKMEHEADQQVASDLAAQEAAARAYQPDFEVRS